MAMIVRSVLLFWCVIGGMLLTACSDSPSSSDPGESSSSPGGSSANASPERVPRLSTDDLSALSHEGYIRFLIPRFDGLDALPRDGLPVLDYQELASKFAQSLQLKAEWVFIDEFAQLIPALKEGRGDVVVTNLTVTKSRLKEVAFSRQIACATHETAF